MADVMQAQIAREGDPHILTQLPWEVVPRPECHVRSSRRWLWRCMARQRLPSDGIMLPPATRRIASAILPSCRTPIRGCGACGWPLQLGCQFGLLMAAAEWLSVFWGRPLVPRCTPAMLWCWPLPKIQGDQPLSLIPGTWGWGAAANPSTACGGAAGAFIAARAGARCAPASVRRRSGVLWLRGRGAP